MPGNAARGSGSSYPPGGAPRRGLPAGAIAAIVAGAVILGGGSLVAVLVALRLSEPSQEVAGEPTEPPVATTPAGGPTELPAPDDCQWYPVDAGGNPNLREVGVPPTDVPDQGVATMTITTNHGAIEVRMDTAAAPCTAASLTHLATQGFYDGSPCHRLVTEGIFVLQCGDPSGTGTGGPTYRYAEENLPAGESPAYPRGVLAMAKTAEPASTGSQFFIVYQDTELPAEYTIVGTVTAGLDIVERVAAGGHDNSFGAAGGGQPNTEVIIETLRVTGPA